MKIIKPHTEIKFPKTKETANEMIVLVEEAARLCYKSEGLMGENFNSNFIRDKIDKGHLSVSEHSLISVKFVCDRGVSHELVRHRIASFSQESTRYCNYSQDKFGNEITVIEPFFWEHEASISECKYCAWEDAMGEAEKHYFKLIEMGAKPQEARSVLPNSLKTEVIMSANFREWRHFMKLRTAPTAHPQMREVTIPLLAKFKELIPVIFDDIII